LPDLRSDELQDVDYQAQVNLYKPKIERSVATRIPLSSFVSTGVPGTRSSGDTKGVRSSKEFPRSKSSGDTIPNCWGEFPEIGKSKERRGITGEKRHYGLWPRVKKGHH
jgi:hypothetical protein